MGRVAPTSQEYQDARIVEHSCRYPSVQGWLEDEVLTGDSGSSSGLGQAGSCAPRQGCTPASGLEILDY